MERIHEYLWTGLGDPPPELLLFAACRVWHAPPSVVRKESAADLLLALFIEREIEENARLMSGDIRGR